MTTQFYCSFPICNLLITIESEAIVKIEFISSKIKLPLQLSGVEKQIALEFKHYFKDPKFQFAIPLAPQGTPFQMKVWKILQSIPAGQTMTYGEIAKQLLSSPRAVGNACRANPIPIIIPCHRVVGKNHLGGYFGQKTGALFNIKEQLLSWETHSALSSCRHSNWNTDEEGIPVKHLK